MWILYPTNSTRELARRQLRRFKFDSNAVHHAGVKHRAFDALSRLQAASEDETALNDNLALLAIHARNHDTPILAITANRDEISPQNAQTVTSVSTALALVEIKTEQALDQ